MRKRKRICFICLVNLFLLPYMKKYISVIECDYDIIFWNRYGLNEKSGANKQYSYEFKVNENASKFKKLQGYIGFANYAKRIIRTYQYDCIILTATNAGMFLRSTLRKYYKGRYIIDIRDYTMEKNVIFYQLEKSMLKYAAINIISSEGYKKFLPPGDYIVTHNELDLPVESINTFRMRNKNCNDKIVLTYIGLIRFHNQNKKIIDIFCNDSRFEIRFIGADAYALRDYCIQKRANNVVLIDRFQPEKTFEFLMQTDIILNLYGNNTPLLDYALSNKLYYAAKLGMPILVCPNTYMEEISVKFGFGYTFDIDDPNTNLDNLYTYFKNISWSDFYKSCDVFLEKVRIEVAQFNKMIKKYTS